jgi:hypothetical protein
LAQNADFYPTENEQSELATFGYNNNARKCMLDNYMRLKPTEANYFDPDFIDSSKDEAMSFIGASFEY